MTARELIEIASKLPPDALVFLESDGQMMGTVEYLVPVGDDGDDEERIESGEEPLATNWRKAVGAGPGPAIMVGFKEA